MNQQSQPQLEKSSPAARSSRAAGQVEATEAPAAEQGEFQASDGYCIAYRRWRACADSPLGYVVALHGIQSHSGWYEFSGSRLSAAGFEVCFPDRRGSGQNETERGDAVHVDRLINDVVQFASDVRWRRDQAAEKAPVILLGVSWGGKLAAVTASVRPELFDGLALLSPGVCSRFQPRRLQRLMLKLAVACGGGVRMTPIPLDDPALFTGEGRWQQFIAEDPLALHEVTASFLKASCDLDEMAQEAPEKIVCPSLLMLAGRDRIIDNAATKRFFEQFAAPAREVIEYAEADHTLEFDRCREEFMEDLIGWLKGVGRR